MSFLRKGTLFLIILTLILGATGVFAAEKGSKEFTKDDLKKMSTFLSNFTEVGFMDFDAKDITKEDDPADMIRFGIWHNYVNNFKSRVGQCKVEDCEWGSLVMDGKYVAESIKKFFDWDYTKMASVVDSDPPYFYDGRFYHFEGADGEAVYYARVEEAFKDPDGRIVMKGEIFNADDEEDVLGTFEALAKPHKFGGKDTWAILSIATEYND